MSELQSILHAQASSDKDLITAMENNYYAHVSYIAQKSRDVEVIDNDYLMAISTGFVGRTVFLDDEIKIKNIIDLLKLYYKFLTFSWFVTPCTKPENLTTLLSKYGFHLTKAESGMAFTIKSEGTLKPKDKELSLSLVDSPVSLDQFDQLYAEIWNCHARNYFKNAKDIILQADCPLELYIGYAQGQPVAICELFFEAGIVGIYSVGTVKSIRHNGFASSFLADLLSNITQRGYEIITLQSTSEAMNMYNRLGFSKLCTFYEYQPV